MVGGGEEERRRGGEKEGRRGDWEKSIGIDGER